MEKDNVNILNIDLSQYLEEIEKLRAQLEGLSKDSAEYAKATQDIKNKQLELTQQILQEAQAFKGLKEATELNNVLMASSRLEADEYAESINGIKQHIKDLETIANSMELGTEEYAKVTAQAKNLKDALKDLKGDTAEARLAANEYANTLNGMRAKLSDMKAVMGNMEMGSDAFKEMAKDAKALNDEISKCEQSYGVFSRNVGNYANSFKEAFSDMSLSVENVAQKTEYITSGLQKAKNKASEFVKYMKEGFYKDISTYIKNCADGIKNFGTNFKNAYAEATKGNKGLITSMKGLTSGLNAAIKGATGLNLALLPAIATVAAIAAAVAALLVGFAAIKAAIEEDEQAARDWDEAMADMELAWDNIKNLAVDLGKELLQIIIPLIQKMGELTLKAQKAFKLLLAQIAEWRGNKEYAKQLRDEVANIEEQRKLYREVKKEQNELTDLKRENLKKEKEIEKSLYESREKYNDKEGKTIAERKKANQEILDAENQLLDLKEKELKKELEILQLNSQKGANNKETNDAIAKAEANLAQIAVDRAKVSAEATKREQALIRDSIALTKEEMQAQIKLEQMRMSSMSKTSDAYKEAEQRVLRMQRDLEIQDVKNQRISAKTKQELIDAIIEKYKKQGLQIDITFNTDKLDEEWKSQVEQWKQLPELSKDVFDKMEQRAKAYKDNFIDNMKKVAKAAVPEINIGDTFIADVERALDDLSKNFIPLTFDNVKKYFKTLGWEITDDSKRLFEEVSKVLNIPIDDILVKLNSFNTEIKTIGNQSKLNELDKGLQSINQSMIALDSTYRQFAYKNEINKFLPSVAEFKDGEKSINTYISELSKLSKILTSQNDVLRHHADLLDKTKRSQGKELDKLTEYRKELEYQIKLGNDTYQNRIRLKNAIIAETKAQENYIKTMAHLRIIKDDIQGITDETEVSLFNFDVEEIANISDKLKNSFINVEEVVKDASGKIQDLFSDIFRGDIPNDPKDIGDALDRIREYLKDKYKINDSDVATMLRMFVPDPLTFKEKANELLNEVEKFTQHALKSEMKWYDEGSKKILQAEERIMLERVNLEKEQAKLIEDETYEQKQQRIYEATVEYDQAILDWERIFFDERRKEYEEESKSDYLSPEHVEYAFKEQKEALKKVYNEQMEMLKTQLEDELITEEEYEQKKLELKQKYNDAKKSLDANEDSEMSKVENENDPLKSNEIDAEERMIEQEKQILEEWYAQKLVMYAGNEEMILEIQKEYAQRSMKITNDVAQNEEAKFKRRMSITQQWASATGKLFSQVAQYMEQDIEDKKKKGEATEEEMHKEFELMKAFQISAAIIDTLSGALGIYMSYLSAPGLPWVNQALGWTSMGLALTSGFFQIQQIESTRFGDSNTSAAGGMSQIAASPVSYSNVNVNPLLDQNADLGSYSNLSVNATDNEENEIKVVILESDIQESNARVAMRQARTSF